MKKIISLLLAHLFLFSSMCFASAEAIMLPDFEITNDGEITAYYGAEWVVVPEEIDGIKVTKIGEKTFFDLGIEDAYLPEGLLEIGTSAFEGSTVRSITLPSTLTRIGERAFANCDGLYTIFADLDETVSIEADAFAGTRYLQFYVNCDVDVKALDEKVAAAKGNRNYKFSIRHIDVDYNDNGDVVCKSCGFVESSTAMELPFSDVPFDSWYFDAVHTAYQNKIINGKSEHIFDPNATMTCAEAAKMAASVLAIFADPIDTETQGPWYQPYVDYCYENGLIEETVVFDWEKPITRAQMAYLFSKCDPWDVDINDVPPTDIPDVVDTTPFASEIRKLYNKGIAVGDASMYFHPNDNIKRCEAAAIIARIISWDQRIELAKG